MLIALVLVDAANALATVPDSTVILPSPPVIDQKFLDALSTVLTFVIAWGGWLAHRWTSVHLSIAGAKAANELIDTAQARLTAAAPNAIAYAESLLGKDAKVEAKVEVAAGYLGTHLVDSVQQLPDGGRQFIRARLGT